MKKWDHPTCQLYFDCDECKNINHTDQRCLADIQKIKELEVEISKLEPQKKCDDFTAVGAGTAQITRYPIK